MAQIPIYNPTQGLSSAAGPVYGNEPNAVETEASFESDYFLAQAIFVCIGLRTPNCTIS